VRRRLARIASSASAVRCHAYCFLVELMLGQHDLVLVSSGPDHRHNDPGRDSLGGLLRAKMRRPPTPQKSDGEEHNNPVQAQDQVLQGDQRNFLQYIDEAHFPRGKSRRSSRPSGLSVLDRGLVSSRPVSTLGDRYLGSCGPPSQEHVLFCEALFLLLA
jgi:hypothetical protein